MSPVMLVHVSAGAVAVLAGATALFSRKGSPLHRGAGNIFFISMLIMSAAGAYIAYQLPQMITFLAGVFTFYLVTTAWLTVKREEKKSGAIEIFALISAAAIGAGGIYFGLEAQASTTGLKDGFSPEPYFFFGGLALLAAALDAAAILRGGLKGRQRIARHLWRMCFALYIAAGSLFTGPGAKVFPDPLQGSPILAAPEAIIALMMLFWLIRVLLTRWYEKG